MLSYGTRKSQATLVQGLMGRLIHGQADPLSLRVVPGAMAEAVY